MPSNVIASAALNLETNAASFAADLGKASRAVSSNSAKINRSLGVIDKGFDRLDRKVKAFGKSMFSLKAGLGAVAGTGGLGLLTKRSLDAADAIAKTADAAGISTDALQELRFASQIAGLDVQALDNAMLGFGKRLGELRQGTGSLDTFLKKLDESFRAQVISARDADAAFNLIVQRLSETENASDRAALAAAAFGRSAGVKMALLIKNGTGALNAMRQEAHDLGGVLEENLLRQSEAANDALTRVSTTLNAEVTRALVGIAPVIVKIGEAFAKLVKQIDIANGTILSFFDPELATESSLQEALDGLNEKIVRMQMTLDNPAGTQPALLAAIRKGLDENIARAGVLQARLDFLRGPDGQEAAAEGAERKTTRLRVTRGNRRDVTSFADDLQQAHEAAGPAMARAVERARQARLELEAQGRALTELVDPQEAYNARVLELDHLLAQGVITRGTYSKALLEAKQALFDATAATDTLAQATNDLAQRAINGQIKSWRDLGVAALDVLQKIIFKQIELNQVASAGGGGSGGGGLFRSIFGAIGGGFGGGTFGVSGGAPAGFVPGFAEGGDPPIGRAAIVGERGPELFVPKQRGSVIPNHELAGMGGGITINQTNDFRGAELGSMPRIKLALEQNKRETIAEIEQRVNDGGRISKIMGRRRG